MAMDGSRYHGLSLRFGVWGFGCQVQGLGFRTWVYIVYFSLDSGITGFWWVNL